MADDIPQQEHSVSTDMAPNPAGPSRLPPTYGDIAHLQHLIDVISHLLESGALNSHAELEIPELHGAITMRDLTCRGGTCIYEPERCTRIRALVAIGMLQFHKFGLSNNPQTLKESKESWSKALENEALGADLVSPWWFAYAIYLERVFQHTGDHEHLDEAYDITERLVRHAPLEPNYSMFLSALSTTRYGVSKNFTWLDQSAQLADVSLDDMASVSLLAAARAKATLFDRTQNPNDIGEAISLTRRAIGVSRPEDVNLARHNLACLLTSSYEALPNQEPLQRVNLLAEAIDIGEDLVTSTTKRSKYFSTYTDSLGTMLMHKYERSRTFSQYAALFEPFGVPAEFIDSMVDFVARSDDPDEVLRELPFLSGSAHMTAASFTTFCRSIWFPGNLEPSPKDDIDQAINHMKASLEVPEESQEGRAGHLFNLAKAHSIRHRDFGDQESMNESIGAAREALKLEKAPVTIRVQSGVIAAGHAEKMEDWEEAASLHDQVVGLIPTIMAKSSSRSDFEYILRKAYGASANAAAAALQAGRSASQVLELLERSRGLIASQLISARNDVSDLALHHPDKCREYERLRSCVLPPLDTAGMSPEQIREAVSFREKEERKLSLLEDEIRTLPGFSRFQQALNAADLSAQAQGRHIVYFNIAHLRSDAICVSEAGIRNINLPKLKFDDITTWATYLTGNEKRTRATWDDFAERNEDILKLLVWLWQAAVEPVLVGLDLLQKAEQRCEKHEDLPHIIWIPTGYLSFFPIHAAGFHRDGSTENTLSHVLSSYATTIRSIMYAQEKSKGGKDLANATFSLAESQDLRVLAVKVPKALNYEGVGYQELDVNGEVTALQETFSEVVVLDQPSRTQVMRELQAAQLVHFACHGVSNATDPSRGALLLYDTAAGATSPLTIQDLVSANYGHAGQVAYLSACSTAENTAPNIADEAIHLSSTFQLAGFPHVVGTLWEADDEAAKEVAAEFYAQLKELSARESPHRHGVALALHRAVVKYRERDVEFPIAWAPFVHFGA